MQSEQKIAKSVRRRPSLWVLLGLLAVLGGCGQKGDLVLPEQPASTQTTAQP